MRLNSFRRYYGLLRQYLEPQRAKVLLLALLLFSSIAVQLLKPQILRAFIDAASAGSPIGDLTDQALLFLAAAIIGQTLSFIVTYLGQTVAWQATNALRLDLTVHCLSLDMSFHKAHTPGELIERIDGDIGTLSSFFSEMVLRLLANGLLAGGILVLLFVENWRAGCIGIAYALATALVLRRVGPPLTRAWTESRQAEADLLGFLGERLAGTEDIRSSGAESHVLRQLYIRMRRISRLWISAKLVQGVAFDAVWMVTLAARVVSLALGAWLYAQGQATIGAVYLIFGYISQMEAPMDAIRRRIDDLQKANASITRVQELLDEVPTICEPPRATYALPDGPLAVEVRDLTFCYDDTADLDCTDPVLSDVSFALEPGQVLGLLGRTGSGKTTLSRLLFRLYDPSAGTVRLSGIDIRDLPLGDLRSRVGLVTQEVQIFGATARDNLTLFRAGYDDADLLDALRNLELWPWYKSLPEGLDTVLQPSSQGLSAGQAQIFALSRVFLRDPGLVILDEASSRLDPATEQQVERAVDTLLTHRTAIVIAHRLRTVQRADTIAILEGGQVVEYGARQTLAEDPHSRFAQLLQTGLQEVLA